MSAPGNEGKMPPLILLIENDENDVFILRRALNKADWQGDLRVVGSVSEARAYLENSFPFKEKNYYRRPSLIISDYRLNSQTALDFVVWMHRAPEFCEIPTVVLTGAASHIPAGDLARMRVQGFIVKNPDVLKLAAVLKQYLPDRPHGPGSER